MPCCVNTPRVLAKSGCLCMQGFDKSFSKASAVLIGFKITWSFALDARLSSVPLGWLAGSDLQNGCVYFPDKSGIVPNIKRKLVKCLLICYYCNWEGFYVPLEIFVPFLSLYFGDSLVKNSSVLLIVLMLCAVTLLEISFCSPSLNHVDPEGLG